KNQDAYERELIPQLAKLDPSQEAGLQHFWEKAWAAYARGDLNGAIEQMTFIRDNYRNPNVKRQSSYWIARSIERLGRKEEAGAIYRTLSSAPYDDVYAKFAEQRGAPHATATNNPLTMNRPDWRDIAERNMPRELRLAYELTALADVRDARLEIQRNRTRRTQPYADALNAELYNYGGDTLSMMRALRAAFPQLATVEQDSVPPYFRNLVDLFGGKSELAIASYNAGQGNVLKWRRAAPSKPMDEFLESIPFPETRNYVKRVTMLSAAYARMVN